MEISYWQSRWIKGNTGWHMDEVFPPLKNYWHHLQLAHGATILVPLCGKTLDIEWFVGQAYYVIGIDVSEKAIEALKHNHSEPFCTSSTGGLTRYKSDSLELWCGDFFKLQKNWLPPIDAIYDKAALIALPPETRRQYAKAIKRLCQPHTRQFLSCFEYNQDEMNGPPFAVFEDELQTHYSDRFHINLLYSHSLMDELTGFHRRGLHSYLTEKIYHLTPERR